MELDFALLADSVSVNPADGKLTIVGAGIDTVVAPAVPAQHGRIMVVVRALVSSEEAEHPHRLDVVLRSDDGTELGAGYADVVPVPEQVRAASPVGLRTGLGMVLTLDNIVFPAHGAYQFILRWDGDEVRALQLAVVEPPPAPA